MALYGALHGKQPGRKQVFREVTATSSAWVESFNDELATVDSVQITFVTPQALGDSVYVSHAINGTDVTITLLTELFAASEADTTLKVRAYGQTPV